ncbi:hypothetical protein [Saccharothrix sp. ALI-22-I]|uniref:hypothetical protein n=1 Tax=Saccharothrix sp. ALI-22-I TaxID=1933778 RepID=UPI000A048961|nr:hypothetical protein [Saccharothrix sp. ALI-22-I]
MSNEARRAAVAALAALAGSPDYRDRADAGHGLAGFAEMPEARPTLRELVLDAGNTFVTRVTAGALLRRRDAAGFETVASAFADADDNHADWIHTAVLDVFILSSRERDAAVRECTALTQDPDEQVRRGADKLIASLTKFNTVLRPAEDGPPAT